MVLAVPSLKMAVQVRGIIHPPLEPRSRILACFAGMS